MKIRVTVGDVEVRTDGLELTKRQVVDLLRELAGIAVLTSASSSDDTEQRSQLGFTAHLELDPQRNDEPDLSEWFEDHS